MPDGKRIMEAALWALIDEAQALLSAVQRDQDKEVKARGPEMNRRLETYQKAFQHFSDSYCEREK